MKDATSSNRRNQRSSLFFSFNITIVFFFDESRKKKWVQSIFCWNSKYVFCWNSAPSQWSILCLELKKWGCVPASSTLPTPNKDRVQLSHQPHSASFKVIVKPLYIEPMILTMVTIIISSRVIYYMLRFVDLFCIGISQTDTALTIHFLKTGCFWHNRTAIHYAFSTTRKNKQVRKIKLHFDHGIKRSIFHSLGVHEMMDNWLMYSA